MSAKESRVAEGKMEVSWEFYRPVPGRKAADEKDQSHEINATHTFENPGLYEVALTVKSGEKTDSETLPIWVTTKQISTPPGGIVVEGNGVRIADGDDTPSAFDHTHFGTASQGERIRRTFELFNRGSEALSCSPQTVTVTGTHAADFRITHTPRNRIAPRGYACFAIEFQPHANGTRTAEVTVRAGDTSVRFAVAGKAATK